jgi:DUF4097 and DUF4098 domain-containing protein YvlB
VTYFFSIAFLIGFSSSVDAQVLQPVTRSLGEVESVVIRGFKGKLQINQSTGDELKVEARKTGAPQFDQSTYHVRQKGGQLEILVRGPSETEDWEKLRAGTDLPEFEMKVTLPPKKLEIFWGKGQVVLEGFTADVSLQVTEGDVAASNGAGHLMLQLINGRGKLVNHKGPVDVQTFRGQMVTEKTQGYFHINNHSATYRVTDHKGPMDVRNHSGSVLASQIQGALTVKNVSGQVNFADVDGSLVGEIGSGRLSAKFQNLQNFSLQSERGTVTLEVPKSSGANVNLRSEKGKMYAPMYLGKSVRGRWTERKGRLKGDEQGNIKIVSKYGDIVLK